MPDYLESILNIELPTLLCGLLLCLGQLPTLCLEMNKGQEGSYQPMLSLTNGSSLIQLRNWSSAG